MENQTKAFISEIVEGKIGYFKFLKGNDLEAYNEGMGVFKALLENPGVDRLVVVVEDEDTMFGKEMQGIWLMTGELADANGFIKWGVVVPSLAKEITIRYLVEGGKDGSRDYEHLISDDEQEVMDWARE